MLKRPAGSPGQEPDYLPGPRVRSGTLCRVSGSGAVDGFRGLGLRQEVAYGATHLGSIPALADVDGGAMAPALLDADLAALHLDDPTGDPGAVDRREPGDDWGDVGGVHGVE